MEAISDTLWDVVICGTGLQQSLLALALSRSDKKILHIDPNEYYGGAEASLSLQEADAWTSRHGAGDRPAAEAAASPFASASVTRLEKDEADTASTAQLGPSRTYALALAPQLLHSRCALVSQLVSSRAYRQLEFLAVSSFFVVEAAAAAAAETNSTTMPSLVRIPATREDVFATTALASRAKRQLMKFLKFVVAQGGRASSKADGEAETGGEADSEDATAANAAGAGWRSQANAPFGPFLQSEFGLDEQLRDYVLALTLSLDGAHTTVADGLSRLHRHFSSMGAFGPGFAAVYPKWGGCSEVAQVACRAGAVGGAVYMLGAGVRQVAAAEREEGEQREELLEVELTTDERVKTRLVVGSREELWAVPDLVASDADAGAERVSRLVVVVDMPLPFLFESTVEGAPVAGGAVIVLPAGRPVLADGRAPEHPIFVMAHSSDTGECPPGQSVLYLTTIHTAQARAELESALDTLLAAFANEGEQAGEAVAPSAGPRRSCLYRLYYEQTRSRCGGVADQQEQEQQPPAAGEVGPSRRSQDSIVLFPPLAVDMTVGDRSLDAVHEAWVRVMASGGKRDEYSYMVFEDREKDDADEEYE